MDTFKLIILITSIIYGYIFRPELLTIIITIITINTIIELFFSISSKNTLKTKFFQCNWEDPRDPILFFTVEFDLTKIFNFIEEYKKKKNIVLNYEAFVIRAITNAFDNHNSFGKISLGNFIVSKNVNIFLRYFKKENFFSKVIKNCEKKKVEEINNEIFDSKNKLKKEKKDEFEILLKNKYQKYIPNFLINWIIYISTIISYDFEFKIPFLNLEKENFGNLIINIIDSKNYKSFHTPLYPHLRTIASICFGRPFEQIFVKENDEMEIRKVLRVDFSGDHRYADGSSFKVFYPKIYEVLDFPEKYVEEVF